MKLFKRWNYGLWCLLWILNVCFVFNAFAGQNATREFQKLSTLSRATVTSDSEPEKGTKRRACIDPETGKLVSPTDRPDCKKTPIGDKQSKEEAESAVGLKEEQMPDGSTKVDLEGRFKKQEKPPSTSP